MTTSQTIIKALLFTFFLLFISTIIYSQSYEIRAVNKGGGIIGVEVRVTSGTPPATANLITDITFGLKWSAAYNVDLLSSLTTSFNIKKAGSTGTKSGFNFQSFFADPTPFKIPVGFALNQWVEILSVGNNKAGNGTGTFQIAEKGFDPTTDPNIGVDLVDYTPVIANSAAGVIIPITLSSFHAQASGRVIKLDWTTESEQNNKGFIIERTANEGGNYKAIGWVGHEGNGSGKSVYSFTDKEVVAKMNYYYRLKQEDWDGKYTYSQVKTAMLQGVDGEFIRLASNPVTSLLRLYFGNVSIPGDATLKVVDTKGSVCIVSSVKVEVGKEVAVNVSKLAGGQYFVILQRGNELIYSKPFQKR